MDLLVVERASERWFMVVYIVKLTIKPDIEMVTGVAISLSYNLKIKMDL